MDIMACCLLSGYKALSYHKNSVLLTKPLFLDAVKCLPEHLELGSFIVFWSFLIVMLDNWRAVILIPYWVCRDLGLINVGLWGGHGTRNDLQ